MTYSKLRSLIEQHEARQRAKLRVKMPCRVPNDYLCNGRVQFASIEKATNTSGDEHRASIVVGIGINYAQEFKWYTPHTPWLPAQASGLPGVEDNQSPDMRVVLNETFDAYESDPQMWVDRNLASHLLLPTPPIPRNYFLVATNFSPFITYKRWQEYGGDPADRAQVLAALDGQMQHLDDLLETLGREVLWVGHGLGSEAFVLFRQWQQRNSVPHWLLTANLSGLSRGKIRAAAGKIRFWQRDRPKRPNPEITKEGLLTDPNVSFDG